MISMINLERLKLARESRGMNQTELNEAAGLPMTTISKAERHELNLSPDALARIAAVTKYPVSFFLAPGGMATDSLAWRRREKVAQRLMSTINAQVNIMRLHVQQLTRELDLTQTMFPFMTLTDTYRPRDVARSLRQLWGMPEAPIANLALALESKCIPVISFHFGTDRVDSRATLTDDRYPMICVNRNHPGDRQRFSLAYQLGHLLMHMLTPVSEEQDTSREANHFAAELLMPEAAIREDIGDKPVSFPLLSNMKRKWGVSMIALLYRADDLGYLSPEQKEELIQLFNKLGLRRNEPVELNVPVEVPRLVQSWQLELKRKQRLSNANLAARLHLLPEELAAPFSLTVHPQPEAVAAAVA